MPDGLFSPYSEFEMNTSLSPEALRAGIAERCMKAHTFSSYAQQWRALNSPSQPPEFAVVRLNPPTLEPLLGMSNSMKPVVAIDMESRDDGGALLKVTIAPAAYCRAFFIVLIIFAIVICLVGAFPASPLMLLFIPAVAVWGAAVIIMSRQSVAKRVAGVEAAFKALIRELESAQRNA